MLVNHTFFDQLPVLSLQTGTPISVVKKIVIDPGQLQIAGFWLEPFTHEVPSPVLLASDIREMSAKGIIIDHADRIASENDLLRLQQILQLAYSPIGSKVRQKNGKKLGKVASFSVDNGMLSIQRLSVESSLLRSFTHAAHIIHRSQILSVSADTIIVEDPTTHETIKESSKQGQFINPFRQPQHNHNQED